MTIKKIFILLCATILLKACGGGGLGTPPLSIPTPVTGLSHGSSPDNTGFVDIIGNPGAVTANAEVQVRNVNNPGVGVSNTRADARGAYAVRIQAAIADELEISQNVNGAISRALLITVPGQTTLVKRLAVGQQHLCVIDANRKLLCKGQNNRGQLGDGTRNNSAILVEVNLANPSQIATGSTHSCALDSNGSVFCWGAGDDGQLGQGLNADSLVPVQVQDENNNPLRNIIQITVGLRHSCALKNDGQAFCWGFGALGQLSNNNLFDNFNQAQPVLKNVIGEPLTEISQIAAGDFHTCALVNRGQVLCWGDNEFSQLGQASLGNLDQRALPSTISRNAANDPLELAIQLAAGGRHTCALLVNQETKCWGRGDEGQMGNRQNIPQNIPAVSVQDANGETLFNMIQIASGADHNCALFNDSLVRCWGRGLEGQVSPDLNNNQNLPQLVTDAGVFIGQNVDPITQIAAGLNTSCALHNTLGAAEAFLCWGSDL